MRSKFDSMDKLVRENERVLLRQIAPDCELIDDQEGNHMIIYEFIIKYGKLCFNLSNFFRGISLALAFHITLII